MSDLSKKVLQNLLPLYSDDEGDAPERVLRGYPDSEAVLKGFHCFRELLLPGREPLPGIENSSTADYLKACFERGESLLSPEIEKAILLRPHLGKFVDQVGQAESGKEAFRRFAEALPDLRTALHEDIRAAFRGDPAALSYAEVKLAYPGILAVLAYRIAHQLSITGVPLIPRIMSEWTHRESGIDIHPGAKIGRGFFIDHGSGVVIGQTAEIGNNVKIYQGAILGAKSFALDPSGNPVKNIKRHPTVEDNVVIYSNATILGGDTVIGKGSTIGGSVFLTKSVPPNSLVMNHPPDLQIKRSNGNNEAF